MESNQVVKSLRNWAIAQARNADIRGMLTGRREAGDAGEEEVFKVVDDVASATVITSFIIDVSVGSTIQIKAQTR